MPLPCRNDGKRAFPLQVGEIAISSLSGIPGIRSDYQNFARPNTYKCYCFNHRFREKDYLSQRHLLVGKGTIYLLLLPKPNPQWKDLVLLHRTEVEFKHNK